MLTDEEDRLIDYLEEQYGCHSFLLYGSRAEGTHRPDSDWDVIALNEAKDRDFCHRHVPGVGEVNAYIFPSFYAVYDITKLSPLYYPVQSFIRLRTGRVLIEQSGLCTAIIAKAREIYARGPQPCPPHFAEHVRQRVYNIWLSKLANPAILEEERGFLRAELLTHAGEIYCQSRNLWDGQGYRNNFETIAANDPHIYADYCAALKSDATIDDLTRLMKGVLGPWA